jgi:hypothetical protein
MERCKQKKTYSAAGSHCVDNLSAVVRYKLKRASENQKRTDRDESSFNLVSKLKLFCT